MPMTRSFFLILRTLFVIAGVTVIAIVVQWSDAVVVPAGVPGPDQRVVDEPRTFDVMGRHPAGDGHLLVEISPGQEFLAKESWMRPGLIGMFADVHWGWLLIGLGLVGCVYPLQATRWRILMRCRGLEAPWPGTLRLVLVGAFCNFFLPGTEGGDVVKAWGAARHSDRRVDAVMSVVFDRITGLAGLVILATVAGLLASQSDIAREIGAWTGLALAAVTVLAIIAFALTMRGWLRLPTVVSTFGGGLPGRLADAAKAYGRHPGAVLGATSVSVGVQVLLASAAACCAWAVGTQHDLPALLAVMPVLFLAAAVPLTWQGAGVMELLGIALLAGPGIATVNQVVGLLLLYRCLELTWGLCGSLLLLGGGIRLHPEPCETPQAS